MPRKKDAGQIKMEREKKFALWEKRLLDALRGVYYRHEFARRNPDVMKESEKVLKALRVSSNQAKTFHTKSHHRYLSEVLIDKVESARGSEQLKRAKTLVNFLRDYGVFPMARSQGDFFPFGGRQSWQVPDLSAEERLADVFSVWFALISFEGYVTFKWKLGRPFMLPVMLLRPGQFGKQKIRLGTFDEMNQGDSFPVVMNLDLPEKRLGSYLAACKVHYSMFQGDRNSDDKKERTQWKYFASVLKAHDEPSLHVPPNSKRPPGDSPKGRRHEFYIKEARRGSSDDYFDTSRKQVPRWLEAAPVLIKNYHQII